MNPDAQAGPAPLRAEAALPLLFVLLWSTGFIGAKFGLPHAEPLTFLSLRYAIVIALMGAGVVLWPAPWPASARAWVHIAVSGLLVTGVYLGGVFIAISRGLPAGVTALVVGVQPLVTALGARLVLGERIGAAQWLGLGLGFAGVALVVARKAGGLADAALVPMLLPAVVALLGITAGTLYQKRYCPRFDLRTGALIQFVPCLVATAGAAALTEARHIDWAPPFVFALAWLVLVLSLGAVSLLNLLIRRGSAVRLASLFYLTPPATALIAWAAFDERLDGPALVGMALTVLGVWLAHRPPR